MKRYKHYIKNRIDWLLKNGFRYSEYHDLYYNDFDFKISRVFMERKNFMAWSFIKKEIKKNNKDGVYILSAKCKRKIERVENGK